MLIKKLYYGIALLVALAFGACSEDDLGSVEIASALRFEFPQGTASWDKEFEQIAKDYGLYVIYKDLDSLALNRSWTTPVNQTEAYTGDIVTEKYIQVYLDVIKNNILVYLNKDNESVRKLLPIYLFVLNNYHNNKGQTMQINTNGFDYWVLSFTEQELLAGLNANTRHKIACTFGYLPISAGLNNDELEVPAAFIATTDYESPIATEANNVYLPFNDAKDPVNYFPRRGFLPQISGNYTVEPGGAGNGTPGWMPWIAGSAWDPNFNRNSGYEKTLEARYLKDFVNYIRYAMVHTWEDIQNAYPLDAADPLDQKGNAIIQKKYGIIIQYMESKGYDLQGIAGILKE